jgi:ribosome maturation factor RimP
MVHVLTTVTAAASIELIKAVIEDVIYDLKKGELVVDAEGMVVTVRGEKPQIQFKMDACRAMSKIQQTSIGYTFPNVSEAPNSS